MRAPCSRGLVQGGDGEGDAARPAPAAFQGSTPFRKKAPFNILTRPRSRFARRGAGSSPHETGVSDPPRSLPALVPVGGMSFPEAHTHPAPRHMIQRIPDRCLRPPPWRRAGWGESQGHIADTEARWLGQLSRYGIRDINVTRARVVFMLYISRVLLPGTECRCNDLRSIRP